MEGDPGRILAALREPRSYPRGADRVEVIETHISRVHLAGDYAYKVKKPVALGFLDFSTLEARRFFCEEELRLNRRTAPELYIGVVPIVEAPGGVRVGGEGGPLEYAVEMRRFPQDALADGLARRGELAAPQVDAIAAAVAAFHASIPPAPDGSEHGTPERVTATALASFAQLDVLASNVSERNALGDVRAWTLRKGERLRGTFAVRKRDGFVRECHGDLHLGNIAVLEGRPVLFDCVEFDPVLRWIDVMNEVAFLMMDLLEHGLAAAAWRFLNAYLETTGDYAGVRVRYFDHHFAGEVPVHANLEAVVDASADLCTSVLVDRYLGGRFRIWAVVGAFGDNLDEAAIGLGASLALGASELEQLRELGRSLNYNAYGESEADLLIAPAELYARLARYADPRAFIAGERIFAELQAARHADLDAAIETAPRWSGARAAVYVLADRPSSRRVLGTFANHLARIDRQCACAVLAPSDGGYAVSVRVPAARSPSADAFCREFPSGGGRREAAGIERLPEGRVQEFMARFRGVYA